MVLVLTVHLTLLTPHYSSPLWMQVTNCGSHPPWCTDHVQHWGKPFMGNSFVGFLKHWSSSCSESWVLWSGHQWLLLCQLPDSPHNLCPPSSECVSLLGVDHWLQHGPQDCQTGCSGMQQVCSYPGTLPLPSWGIRMVLPVTNQSGKCTAAFNISSVTKCRAHFTSGNTFHQKLTIPSGPWADQDLALFRIFMNWASRQIDKWGLHFLFPTLDIWISFIHLTTHF